MLQKRPLRLHRSAGFTLIEVMITVAIIGILAAVAMPAYTDYLRRAQLPEAFAALADYRVKLEQYFQDFRNYGKADGDPCANGTNAPAWNNFVPSNRKYFTYSCTVVGTGYLLTATGSAGRAVGHTYTLDHNNNQKTTKFKGATVDKSCWLIKGQEC